MGGRKYDNNLASFGSGQRVEEFSIGNEQNQTAVLYESKMLPKVSPQSKFKMLKQNFKQTQSSSEWAAHGQGKQFNFNLEEEGIERKQLNKAPSYWVKSENASQQSQSMVKDPSQFKMIPSRVSENMMSSSDQEYRLSPHRASNTNNEEPGTFVKTIKNMINEFIDSKKMDSKDAPGSSSPGDDGDGKVEMSDTDEDGS